MKRLFVLLAAMVSFVAVYAENSDVDTAVVEQLVVLTDEKPQEIFYVAGSFYLNGEKITTDQYLALAQRNCLEALDVYISKQKKKIAGTVLLCAGAASIITGTTLMCARADYRWEKYHKEADIHWTDPAWRAGQLLIPVGAAVMVTGVPLYCVGKSYQEKSVDTYNECRKAKYVLNIQASGDGIGLALNF